MYSPAPVFSSLLINSGENPRCTEGSVARQRSVMQITARRACNGPASRSNTPCMLGARSSALSSREESTPRVENDSAFSWMALRSLSNSTITMEIPSTICGIGPNRWPTPPNISTHGLWNCSKPIKAAHIKTEVPSKPNATEDLRWAYLKKSNAQ